MKTLFACIIIAAMPVTAAVAATALPEHLARMDANGDGKLSVEEFSTDRGKLFKSVDQNRDGIITRDEATAFYTKIAPIDDPKTAKRISDVTAPDANGDGTTLKELMVHRAADFRARDKDGDGFITAADL